MDNILYGNKFKDCTLKELWDLYEDYLKWNKIGYVDEDNKLYPYLTKYINDNKSFVIMESDYLRALTYKENKKIVDKWISVNDKLPEDLLENKGKKIIPCLVSLKSCYKKGKSNIEKRQRQQKYDYDGKFNGWEWSRSGKERITHWMPLPKLPD